MVPRIDPRELAPSTFPRPIIRTVAPPAQEQLQRRETVVQPPALTRPPVRMSPSATAGGLTDITYQIGAPEMGAVTDIVTSLAGAYAAVNAPQPQYQSLSYNNPMFQPALGIPFVDVIPEAGGACGTKGMVWNPNANCGAGKWQRKSRRRRRRLATHGDLKDLAALKGVLGGGKAFETWIATHGGR